MTNFDNRSPWARKKHVGLLPAPKQDEPVDRYFATRYLTERLPLKYGDLRDFRDRVGKKITTAIASGKLKSRDGQFLFGNLVTWARSKPELEDAVANIAVSHIGIATSIHSTNFGTPSSYQLPPEIEGCRAALHEAHRDLNQLREENLALRATVAALKVYEEKAVERSQAASLAGKKGGRPKKQ